MGCVNGQHHNGTEVNNGVRNNGRKCKMRSMYSCELSIVASATTWACNCCTISASYLTWDQSEVSSCDRLIANLLQLKPRGRLHVAPDLRRVASSYARVLELIIQSIRKSSWRTYRTRFGAPSQMTGSASPCADLNNYGKSN